MKQATKTSYGFKVIDVDQPAIKTTFLPDGTTRREVVEIPGMTPESHPVLVAAYAGDSCYDIDFACGCTRWHGSKSSQAVRAALRRIGLDEQAAELMGHARKVKGKVAPRFY